MRNLKRVLALAMAMVMILGMMVIGSSAASYTDEAAIGEDYVEAVEVLSNMGVFRGQSTTEKVFAPKAILTRAEAATLIYRVITGDVKDEQTQNYDYASLKDVKAGDWYTGYVTYSNNGGYIKGDDLGNFNPYQTVTGIQVMAIMLRAAGYGQNGEYEGAAWMDNILTDAQELGITGKISTATLNAPASREVVAQLIFNAITSVDMVTYAPALGYIKPIGKDAQNLGEKVFGLTKVTGVVTANEKADLYGDETLAAGKTVLDNKAVYNLTTDESILGEKVTFWAYQTGKTMTAVSAPKSLATVTDWSNMNLSVPQSKKVAAATTAATEIFYNYDPAEKAIFGKGITAKAIDNNGDGKYEYILNVKKTFAEVQYVSTAGVITMNGYANIKDYVQNAYEGIAKGDKVLVVSYDGNTWIEAADYVTGYISGYDMSTTVKTATINDEKYQVSGIIYEVVKGKTTQFTKVIDTYFETYNGTTYNYYQDSYGNIIAYEKADELATEYALILDYDWYKTGPWATEMWVKYLTTEGEVVTDIVDEDTSWGWQHNDGDVVEYRLNADGEFVEVYEFDIVEGETVAINAKTDRATIGDAVYNVNDSFVAFFYQPVQDGKAIYGVLTGAEAIAELSSATPLWQYDATRTGTSHVEKYGMLKMVNVRDVIDADKEYCYILDTEAFASTTAVEQGDLYFYNAVNAAGEEIVVTLRTPLNPNTTMNVGAYYTMTINLVKGGTMEIKWFENVENVLYGDLHASDDNTVYVYEWNDQTGAEYAAPAAVVDVSGKTVALTELDKDYCATGYAVVEKVRGADTAVAIFVTEVADGDVDYIDCTTNDTKVHLYVGSSIMETTTKKCYKVEGLDKAYELHAVKGVPVLAAWAGKKITITAIDPCTTCNPHDHTRTAVVKEIGQPSANIICAQGLTGYTTRELAIAAMTEMNLEGATALKITLANDALAVASGVYTDTGKATAGTDAQLTGTETITNAQTVLEVGNILILKITATDGTNVGLNCNNDDCVVEAVYVAVKIVE